MVDTGARTVGLELDGVSPSFRELFAAARIIVAKGMGHFETMSHLPRPPGLVSPPGQMLPRGPGPGGGLERLFVRPGSGACP